ncbi:MAG: hypothetical protein JWM34_1302 [Ilumatobacteraceae bacterium]|nr:hypothetical protein [Ilumatobacteraceae bacterium]
MSARLLIRLDESQRELVNELAQRRQSSVSETLNAALEALRREESARAANHDDAAADADADAAVGSRPSRAERRALRSDRSYPILGLAVIASVDAFVIWLIRQLF